MLYKCIELNEKVCLNRKCVSACVYDTLLKSKSVEELSYDECYDWLIEGFLTFDCL